MDLRGFDVPANIADILERQIRVEHVSWYQPFVFTDDVATGAAHVWNAGGDQYLCTSADSPETRAVFMRETRILGDWYAHLADVMTAAFPDAATFFDLGCNLAHFGLDLARRGKTYTGIDAPRNAPGVRLLQRITGVDFEFVGEPYDEVGHRIGGFDDQRRFDVGILSAVLMHFTDPHYALPYFASKFRSGCFFSSALAGLPGHAFAARVTYYNRRKPLPHALELVPTEALAESLLRLAGFPFLYRIPYRDGIDPRNTQRMGCWIAARAPIPEEAVGQFLLTVVPDRVDEFTDPVPPAWSSDPLRNQEHRSDARD